MSGSSMDDAWWDEQLEMFDYLGAFPWERWFINHERRARGLPPFKTREVVAAMRARDLPEHP